MEHPGKGGVSKWLERICREKGLSLRQASTKTGLSHATIRGIINGGSASPGSIRKLASAFGGDGKERLAVEDKLLVLAGYRTYRPEAEELSEPMARLLDKLSHLNESQLKLIGHFANFLTEMEVK